MVKFGENMGPKQLDPHQRQSSYAGCADGWELLTDTKNYFIHHSDTRGLGPVVIGNDNVAPAN